MAELKFDTVDVFTENRYEGNPLAIVHVPASISLTQAQKQRIAAEFNLSETVILHENPDDAYERKVDIFLVDGEIPFAGHPTIGTVAHIGSHGPPSSGSDGWQTITLHIKAGTCRASYHRPTGVARASIPFDVYFSSLAPASSIPHAISETSHTGAPVAVVSPTKGMTFMLVEMGDVAKLSSLSTDTIRSTDSFYDSFVRPEVKPAILGTYYWTCSAFEQESEENGQRATFTIDARMMLQSIPPEDPATGSAACTLACAISTWRRWTGNTLGPDDGADASKGHRPKFFDSFAQPEKTGRRDRYEVTQGRDMGRLSRIVVEVVLNEKGEIAEVILEGKTVEVMRGTLKA